MYDDLKRSSELRPTYIAERWVPHQPMTIVPLALGLSTVMNSTEEAILLAAQVGGDSDSVASIAGAILGARCPHTVNNTWHRAVEEINEHSLRAVARELANLRR